MEQENEILEPIAIGFLYDGMVLTEDIYNYDGKLLLLSKGEILTKRRIQKLRNFNHDFHNIMVPQKTHRSLISHGTESTAFCQDYLEKEIGYSQIKSDVKVLLANIQNSGTISKRQANDIVAQMAEALSCVDTSLIFQCINTLSPMDEYLCRHSINVGLLNGLMAKWLQLSPSDTELLVLSGLVHDIGKTKVPVEILNAPRKLTSSEFEIMKMHPIYSEEILNKDIRFPQSVKNAARQHHEKINGSGYPDSLNLDEISLFARITSISDIYDAMVAKRAYKEAQNPFLIISQLKNMQFSDLDIGLVNLFTDKMPSVLVGKRVLLSNGSVGVTKLIIPDELEYPLVEIDDRIVKTNKNLYCLRLIIEE